MTILEAMNDAQLFGPVFKRRWLGLGADTWAAWRAFLAALFALPLEGDALELMLHRDTGQSGILREMQEIPPR